MVNWKLAALEEKMMSLALKQSLSQFSLKRAIDSRSAQYWQTDIDIGRALSSDVMVYQRKAELREIECDAVRVLIRRL